MGRVVRTIRLVGVALALAGLAACAGTARKNDLLQAHADAERAYAAEDWRAAEKYYRMLTERVPGEGEYWFRLGNVYARTHQPDAAVAAYKEALLRQNDKSKSWHNMGIVYLRQAANAFTSMLAGIDEQDPLFRRAMALNEAVLKMLDDVDAGAQHEEPE